MKFGSRRLYKTIEDIEKVSTNFFSILKLIFVIKLTVVSEEHLKKMEELRKTK